jgi:hypothetical protein
MGTLNWYHNTPAPTNTHTTSLWVSLRDFLFPNFINVSLFSFCHFFSNYMRHSIQEALIFCLNIVSLQQGSTRDLKWQYALHWKSRHLLVWFGSLGNCHWEDTLWGNNKHDLHWQPHTHIHSLTVPFLHNYQPKSESDQIVKNNGCVCVCLCVNCIELIRFSF